MTFQHFIKSGCAKSLVVLCMVQLLPACSSSSSGLGVGATTSVTVNWSKPATREDGTPISPADISAYRVYYGTKSGVYLDSVEILSDGISSDGTVTVNDVPTGLEYFFVGTTVDTEGRESQFSDEANLPL